MAAQKPATMASTAQRNGQGKALRTAMRGALTVKRRINNRSRIGEFSASKSKQPPELAFGRLLEMTRD
jgi:hypothetical protein